MGNICQGHQQGAEQVMLRDAEPPAGGRVADPAAVTSSTQQQGQQREDTMLEILQLLRRRDERDQRIETNARKSAGDYFVTTGALWRKNYIEIGPKNVEAVQSCKEAVSLIAQKIQEFPLIDCSLPEDEVSSYAEGGKLSIPDPNWCLDNMRKGIFNGYQKDRNIFFTSVTKDRKDNAPGQKSLAHSVAADGICSVFWPPYLELLTGASGDESWRFYAVHGRMADETQYADIKNKGIKNVAQNLLALPPDHGTFYEGSGAGSLFIIPIVDLEKPVDYLKKNQYFDLLVAGKSKSVYNWIYNGAVAGTANIFSESLDATVEDADEVDIRIGTKFLNYYAKAAAYIAVNSVKKELSNNDREGGKTVFEDMYERMDPVKPSRSESSRRSESQQKSGTTARNKKFEQRISSIIRALKDIESDGICVPEVRQGFDFVNDKVLKVKLKKYFDDVGLDLSLYPSWGLLGLKATANWLVFAEQPLIPACLDPETVPVPSIEIGSGSSSSGSHTSDLSFDAISSPRDTSLVQTPATVTPLRFQKSGSQRSDRHISS